MPGMTQLIERAALVNPKGIASHFQGRDTTWAQLRELVPPLAGAFVAAGLRAGDRIAILSANSDFYFQYFFAAPWAGGVVTLNYHEFPVAERCGVADFIASGCSLEHWINIFAGHHFGGNIKFHDTAEIRAFGGVVIR